VFAYIGCMQKNTAACHSVNIQQQESHAVARNPRDAASVIDSRFADMHHVHSIGSITTWNTLPDDVEKSAPSASSFRQQLNAFLSHQSFPDIIV